MAEEDATPDVGGVIAIALGIIAWVSFLLAFFMARDPFFYLLFAIVCGTIALVLGVRARRAEAAAAGGAAAAGAAMLYGVSIVAALTAMVWATGILLLLVMIFFLAILASGGYAGGGWGCGDEREPRESEGCCEACCGDCGASCCDCGGCDCGGCGGGCGDCGCGGGGCGCIGFGMVLPYVARPRGLRERISDILARGMPHHPDLPQFAADVYVVRGARWCIGCFTTYPVFLLASAVLIAFAPASSTALLAGLFLASLQAVSSAGLAKRRGAKVLVKTALGLGLALVVSGIHSSAWPPAAKVAALLVLLALGMLSALPRARRMRAFRRAHHQHEGIAGVASSPTAR